MKSNKKKKRQYKSKKKQSKIIQFFLLLFIFLLSIIFFINYINENESNRVNIFSFNKFNNNFSQNADETLEESEEISEYSYIFDEDPQNKNENNSADKLPVDSFYEKNSDQQEKIEKNNKSEPESIFQNPENIIQPKGKKEIYIILDDFGYQDTTERILKLPFKISVAILPGLPYSDKGYKAFSSSTNITPMLHIPMQSINNNGYSEKIEIRVNDDYATIKNKLEYFHKLVPAFFANNHMGSKVSLNKQVASIVLKILSSMGIRFIDSNTIDGSLFLDAGKELGYPVFQNMFFLDYLEDKDLPQREFNSALNTLKNRDFVIIIGHNTKENTLSFLEHLAKTDIFDKYEFLTIRDLFERH